MTAKADTETVPDAESWLDQLDDATALEVMLQDHGRAIDAVRGGIAELGMAVTAIVDRLQADDTARIIYAGAGASIRIAVQDGVELLPTFDWPRDRVAYLVAGGDRALIESVEDAEDDETAARTMVRDHAIGRQDVVLALAASGRTTFTCTVLAEAKKLGALAIGIANNPDVPLLTNADIAIPLLTGGEALAGSTRLKAATAQKICLNMISTLVMTRLGRVRDGKMIAMRPTNAKLRDRFSRIHGDEAAS
ncbi:N-acetylmuramic acid 6-phosphate etherase [Alphaproteobacteria bacterium LSUCC0719]